MLGESVLTKLQQQNFFVDPIQKEVESLLPSLLQWVQDKLTCRSTAKQLLDGL